MKTLLTLTLLLCTITTYTQQKSNVNFDFTGAEQFYNLCKKEVVTESDIENMLAQECYKNMFGYLVNNWGKDYNQTLYDNIFKSCFIPNKHTLKPENSSHKWILNYVTKLKNNPDKIKSYIETTKPHLNGKEVLERAFRYLPETTKNDTVNVYFVVGVNQGCGSKHGVFIDNYRTTNEYKVKKYTLPWIAHESHHFYRAQFNQTDTPFMNNHTELFQAFYWLETEGFAEMAGNIHEDLIGYISSEKNKNQIYRDFSKNINSLNKVLNSYFNNKCNGKDIINVLSPPNSRNIYHETGHLMAYYIQEAFGKDILVKQIGKPLEFVLLYNKAATKLNRPDKIPTFNNFVSKNLINIKM
jgi:hypothetical protein